MRILKFLLGTILLLAAVVVIGGFLLPDQVHVERSIVIDRSPAHVHAIVNSYKRFNEWSPWAGQDPNATYTYSGPVAGVGAKMAWVGDPKTVGSGSQEITASVPDQRVETALDFGEQGKANAAFVLTPIDASAPAKGTKVTWGFDTNFEGNLIGRWFGLVMEKMLAPDYEKGLARLKTLVETLPAADITGLSPEVIEFTPLTILYVSGESAMTDSAAIGPQMAAMYGEITALMKAQDVQFAGQPLSITTSFDGTIWRYDAAVPVDRNDVALSGNVKAGTSPSGKAVRFIHTGPYEGLAAFSERVDAWLTVFGQVRRDRAMDQYMNDPASTAPEQLITHVIVPVE